MLSIHQIEQVRIENPKTYEALKAIQAAINSIAKQTGADPAGVFQTTPNITACNVVAANGLFNVQIIDNAFLNTPALQGRAIKYFVEFATDAGFVNVIHHESWDAVRNQNVSLGNQTLFVRAYSQLQGSAPSKPIAFGNPTVVVGGGAAPPTQQPYQGSGNSANSGAGVGIPSRSPGRIAQQLLPQS